MFYKYIVIELKQWSEVNLIGDTSTNVIVDGVEQVHPLEQALDYVYHLNDTNSAFVKEGMLLAACAYCHNLDQNNKKSLSENRFDYLTKHGVIFGQGSYN